MRQGCSYARAMCGWQAVLPNFVLPFPQRDGWPALSSGAGQAAHPACPPLVMYSAICATIRACGMRAAYVQVPAYNAAMAARAQGAAYRLPVPASQDCTGILIWNTGSGMQRILHQICSTAAEIPATSRAALLTNPVDTYVAHLLDLVLSGRLDIDIGAVVNSMASHSPAPLSHLAQCLVPLPTMPAEEDICFVDAGLGLPCAVRVSNTLAPGLTVSAARVAEAAGVAHLLPDLGLAVHRQFGPWVAFRAVLLCAGKTAEGCAPDDDTDVAVHPDNYAAAAAACQAAQHASQSAHTCVSDPATSDLETGTYALGASWTHWLAVRDALCGMGPHASAAALPASDACHAWAQHRYSSALLRYHYTHDVQRLCEDLRDAS